MSIDHMVEVRKHMPGLPTGPKYVLDALADHTNPEGLTFPSVKTVALYVSMEPRSVQRIMRHFEAHGVLTWTGEHHSFYKTRVYKIDFELAKKLYKKRGDYQRICEQEGKPKELDSSANDTVSGDVSGAPGRQEAPEGVTGESSNPFTDPFMNSARARESSASSGVSNTPDVITGASSGPDNGPGDGTGSDASKERVCDHWRSCEEHLRRAFSVGEWGSWLADLIPFDPRREWSAEQIAEHKELQWIVDTYDPATTIYLAAPTRFIADYVKQHFTIKISRIVRRKHVRVVFRPWAQARRKRAQGAA